MKFFLLRWLLIALAWTTPLGVVWLSVERPASWDVETLDSWSPFQEPGFISGLVSQGLVSLAGFGGGDQPEWLTEEHQQLLDDARQSFEQGRARSGFAYLTVLSESLEEQGIPFDRFVTILLPELVTWLLEYYFTPILLAVVMVALMILTVGTWFVKRFYELVRALAALAAMMIGFVGVVWLSYTIADRPGLIYGLIEYCGWVMVGLVIGKITLAVIRLRMGRRRSGYRSGWSGESGRLDEPDRTEKPHRKPYRIASFRYQRIRVHHEATDSRHGLIADNGRQPNHDP